MYARGFGYFDRMLPQLGLLDNGRPRGQQASFFCLENEHWRIIAFDTGYNSIDWPIIEYLRTPPCALHPEEIAWVRDVVRPRADDPRGSSCSATTRSIRATTTAIRDRRSSSRRSSAGPCCGSGATSTG